MMGEDLGDVASRVGRLLSLSNAEISANDTSAASLLHYALACVNGVIAVVLIPLAIHLLLPSTHEAIETFVSILQ
jgi:hypothetical protein